MTTRREIQRILDAGTFDALVGLEEGQELDFKARPYNLGSRNGRRGLVADVAAFANSRGGIIVVGVETQRDATTRMEAASGIASVRPTSVEETRYRDLVKAHVFPIVRDFGVVRHPGEADGEEVLLVALYVAAQDERDRPFVVDRFPSDDEADDVPHGVGWPTRWGDQTHWERPEVIQMHLARGRSGGAPSAATDEGLSLETEASEDLEFLESQPEWEDWGWYAVQAVPTGRPGVQDFHGEFREQARRWRGLRPDGFDLNLDWDLNPLGPRLASLLTRQGTIIRGSGVTTAGALAYPDFLGWAQSPMGAKRAELDTVILNPWALVEFTFEALRFVYECVAPAMARHPPLGWHVRAEVRHFRERVPVSLRLNLGRGPALDTVSATIDQHTVRVQGTGDPGRDAFSLLARVYGDVFGRGEREVPFAQAGRIDPELFAPSR
ncbi:AlbA family DNA-binding domain-containing protein [Miltoncostaea marina]|uniref:AlbA family DNA-binding domain-containing protein n=1 Tax=Miltoncostaea marina TaxID=2843215 RepID=UPI001C3C8E6B|nr:ATP-binding protein [Miltoncostaea marina]